MAKAIDILEYLKKYVIFDRLILENKLNKHRQYTNLFLHILQKKGRIYKIERNKYTLYDDPFLLASRIIWPSYISGLVALEYHKLTEQVPQNINVITTKNRGNLKINNVKIIFKKLKTENFFGYEKMKYSGFEIFIASPEKAIIDSALLKMSSFSETMEIILNKKLKTAKLLNYLKINGINE